MLTYKTSVTIQTIIISHAVRFIASFYRRSLKSDVTQRVYTHDKMYFDHYYHACDNSNDMYQPGSYEIGWNTRKYSHGWSTLLCKSAIIFED